MLRTVLTINGFYYSPTFDLSRSMQFLGDNTSPEFVSRVSKKKVIICSNRNGRLYKKALKLILRSFDSRQTPINLWDNFVLQSLYERAASWLCWNRSLVAPFAKRLEVRAASCDDQPRSGGARFQLRRFIVPIIHGFVGVRHCEIRGRRFKLVLISRRPTDRRVCAARCR